MDAFDPRERATALRFMLAALRILDTQPDLARAGRELQTAIDTTLRIDGRLREIAIDNIPFPTDDVAAPSERARR